MTSPGSTQSKIVSIKSEHNESITADNAYHVSVK